MIRQNDSIIRLLKEIRDRLPAPPASTAVTSEPDQNTQEASSNASALENNEPVTEGMDTGFDQNSESDQAFEDQGEPQPE